MPGSSNSNNNNNNGGYSYKSSGTNDQVSFQCLVTVIGTGDSRS